MNQTVLDITRELAVERDRWSDSKYLCVIFVKGGYTMAVENYVETWYGIEKVDQRGNIKLYNGGSIKVVNVEGKSHRELVQTCCGQEITTAILQLGSPWEGFNYRDEDNTCFFPNYVMSRLRTEAKCNPRMVII